jgi:hypothetical protein
VPPLPGKNVTRWATTLSRERFSPAGVSQRSCSSRPSTAMGRPFWQYSVITSACWFHAVTSTNVVSCWASPLRSSHRRFRATPKSQTVLPDGV